MRECNWVETTKFFNTTRQGMLVDKGRPVMPEIIIVFSII